MPEKFWVEDISVLVNNIRLLPTDDMTRDEKLNVLMRIIIISTVALYFLKWTWWKEFVFGATLVCIFFKYNSLGCATDTRENFSVIPTMGPGDPAIAQTYITPLFSEEWVVNPALTDDITPLNGHADDMFPTTLIDNTETSYPYGQYLTRTNLLPGTEARLAAQSSAGNKGMINHNGGAMSAKEFANSEWLRNDLAHRENLITTYNRKMNRRYQNNGEGYIISPYKAY
jgi:hypothetical protein